ncbi:glycoside hydrolase family 2 TIM barrel-domain containing protein [Niabella terrae]
MDYKRSLFIFLLLGLTVCAVAQDTRRVYLSGTGADHTVDWDFFCSAGRKSGQWATIAVPSCWEQQGFGAYNYGHDPLKERLNETGTYRYRFMVPKDWKDQEVQIVFEGVMTDAEVRINGQSAGPVHQGAFYEFRYDISRLLKSGLENELEVLVKKHSGNASVNEAERTADFWMFGGIFRPVYLEVKPVVNIRKVDVDARADGTLQASITLANAEKAAKIDLRLIPLPARPELTAAVAELSATVQGPSVLLTGKVSQPLTWNPEMPNRYRAEFRLKDASGKTLHRYTETIGFRTVEVRAEDGIYINGVKVKLKGVNRHTFHPKYGRSSSRELSILDVNTIKDMNMNAVRMSHYPPEKHFLDACDSLGLFVLDELTGWQKPPYDDTVGLKLVREMIGRDVNHPSIILWDNGNEGGNNYHLDDWFERLDIQKREVLHPWEDFKKINTAHYISYDYLAHDGHGRRKIFLPTEFIHGLYDGGAGAGLDDYWEKMQADPLAAGGFIWDYADEMVMRTDRKDSLDSDGNHAPDGILGPFLEKEGSFYTIREIWSPLFFEKRFITDDFDGKFSIENRYHFTNLEHCQIEVSWLRYSGPGQPIKIEKMLSEQISLSVPPGQSSVLQLRLPADWKNYDGLEIRAKDPFGRLINTWSWPVKKAIRISSEADKAGGTGTVVLNDEVDRWRVKAGPMQYTFDKETGLLQMVERSGTRVPLTNGPILISREQVLKSISCEQLDDTVVLQVLFESGNFFKWSIAGDGLLRLQVQYEPRNNNLFAGISFDFPESEVKNMKWLGDGPYRVYKNRMKGARFGLWEKAYNNSVTGESGFVYPEFKGYHSGIYWASIDTRSTGGFIVWVQSDDIFLRMLTPQPPMHPGKTAIEYPPGDISFLHSINAIGTKFDTAQGPQAALNTFSANKLYGGRLEMKLIFDFNL